jgi:hypothetical protein
MILEELSTSVFWFDVFKVLTSLRTYMPLLHPTQLEEDAWQ